MFTMLIKLRTFINKVKFQLAIVSDKNKKELQSSEIKFEIIIITLLPFFIEMLQYDWL